MSEIEKLANYINSYEKGQAGEGSLERPILDSGLSREEAIESILKNKPECPPEILETLELINVKYLGFDEKFHQGQIIVHRDLQQDITDFFKLAIEHNFPIESAIPISEFQDEDEASMSVNNSSGFNFRFIINTEKISLHGFGFAIDINPRLNPVKEFSSPEHNPEEMIVTQPENGEYNLEEPGTLHENHPLVKFLVEKGWNWGGSWDSFKDYQHFDKSLATEEYLNNLMQNLEVGNITQGEFESLEERARENIMTLK